MTAVFSRRGVLGAGAVALGVTMTAAGSAAADDVSEPDPEAPADVATDTAPTDQAPAPTDLVPDVLDVNRPVRSLFAGREGTEYSASSQWSQHRIVLDVVGDTGVGGDPERRYRVEFTTDDAAQDGIYRIADGDRHVATLYLSRVTDRPLLEGIVDLGGEG